MASSREIDILAITEPWLKPSDTLSCLSDLTPPGFFLLHEPRPRASLARHDVFNDFGNRKNYSRN